MPPTDPSDTSWIDPYRVRFSAAINDDLNMPGALAAMHELITEANRREHPAAILDTLYDWDRVLGLRLKDAPMQALLKRSLLNSRPLSTSGKQHERRAICESGRATWAFARGRYRNRGYPAGHTLEKGTVVLHAYTAY